MNRFEQTRPSIRNTISYLIPLVFFIVLLVIFLDGIRSVSDTTLAKQKDSLETALSRSITQCYAVEGAYPPSLEYLAEHYGLTYDKDEFLVDYEYYGSNLIPDVTVLRKQGRSTP